MRSDNNLMRNQDCLRTTILIKLRLLSIQIIYSYENKSIHIKIELVNKDAVLQILGTNNEWRKCRFGE